MLKTPEAKLFDLRLAAYKRLSAEANDVLATDPPYIVCQALSRRVVPKMIYYGIAAYSFGDRTAQFDDQEERFVQMQDVVSLLRLITPRIFMGIFPIDKEYNGERTGFRDYWTAMEDAVRANGIDNLIEDPFAFLMNYWNHDVLMFTVNVTSTMSRISMEQTGKSLIERFVEEHDIRLGGD